MRNRIGSLRARSGREMAPPVSARHVEWSAISSADDLYVQDTGPLVEILLSAATAARGLHLQDLAARCRSEEAARWIQLWPGEHYRLLAGLASSIKPALAVEVGTYQGPGALSLLAGSDVDARVVTYDVVPWDSVPGTVLTPGDFGPRLEQRLGDLAEPAFLRSQQATLQQADLLFVDGPKDGVFEPAFCAQVLPLLSDRRRVVVFDDIRVLPMLQLWRDLPFPKLDATSLGHWSGTGLLLTR